MSEKTLENSYVLRGKIKTMQAPDETLTKAGVPADARAVGLILEELKTGVPGGGSGIVLGHIQSTENPHNVTKSQVGLGNVDNTSDMDKPVSTAQQAAIDAIGNGVVGTVNEHTETLKTLLPKSGGTMTGSLVVLTPTADMHPATKKYADDVLVSSKSYADGKVSDAKTYADSKANAALSDAKTYADSKANAALSDAKTYSDDKIALLWENASPTSEFAEQDITISNLKEYRLYLVLARLTTSTPGNVNAIAVRGYSTRLQGVDSLTQYGESARAISCSGNTLHFGRGVYNSETRNDYLIPVFIYGIKD